LNFKISEEQIQTRVKQLALEIYEYYKQLNVEMIQFIFIATSSFIFASDLIRSLSEYDIKIKSDMISIQSYIGKNQSKIRINQYDLLRLDLDSKTILIVDDILDTGNTLDVLNNKISDICNPKMIDYCCLIRKEKVNRKLTFKIKFIGFDIPDKFIIGYGLDYNGLYRELPYIIDVDSIQDMPNK
jgi:hypoxanthine phosphoribosyltransferase